jgi:hypothetical protein
VEPVDNARQCRLDAVVAVQLRQMLALGQTRTCRRRALHQLVAQRRPGLQLRTLLPARRQVLPPPEWSHYP